MKTKQLLYTLICFVILSIFCHAQKGKSITIFLIGDSTVADYTGDYDPGKNYMKNRYPIAGWGQEFQPFFAKDSVQDVKHLANKNIIVKDKAKGGRSTRTFFQEGRWREVYSQLKKGDYVLIQFGHNDAAEDKPERFVNLEGYKEFLRLYVDQTREKGAIPIILSPVARNYPWKNGKLENVHGEYPFVAKEIAKEKNVAFLDLNQLSMDFFSQKGQEYVTKTYFMNFGANLYDAYPNGQKDNTHFQIAGAKAVASIVFKEFKTIIQNKNIK